MDNCTKAMCRDGSHHTHDLKKGDRVKAIRPCKNNTFEMGHVYTVNGYNYLGNLTLNIPGHENDGVYYDDFELVREEPAKRDLEDELLEGFAELKKPAKRKLRLVPFDLKGMDLECRTWIRGYRLAEKHGYGYEDDGVDSPERDEAISQSIRDCRIFAMAYSMGWLNRHKRGNK